jgi:hypothetical protein
MATDTPYSTLALAAIEAAVVPRLLRAHSAVVLERLARDAGATRWYFIEGEGQLGTLATRVAPGSSLSWYFDDRIARRSFDADVAEEVIRIAVEDGDAVVGRLGADGLEILVEFVAGRDDLDSFVGTLDEPIFVGRFPAPENDGSRSVTLDLPDRDGIVRQHPH